MNTVSIYIDRPNLTESFPVIVSYDIRGTRDEPEIEVEYATAEEDVFRFEGDEPQEIVFAKGATIELTEEEISENQEKFIDHALRMVEEDRAEAAYERYRDRD